jgi:chromosome segregation protein
MRLKRVRIFGFKTFAEKTELSLDADLIAVVGPNGCGKSNIVDAILWGLGEPNARQLRAATSQDVIFSGSPARKALGFAEVSLLFDNEDGALALEAPEVTVSRRVTRSGESEYRINGHACRQRDVFDLFADSGLGRSGYAIVGQREVDSALSASPIERRAWIDEAAGVQRYRMRRTEAHRRLEAARGRLERVGDLLREIDAQREPLRDEAEAAKRYRALRSSLEAIERSLLVQELAQAASQATEAEARIAKLLATASEEEARAARLEHAAREAGEELAEVERQIDAHREVRQAMLTARERAASARQLAEQRLASIDALESNLADETEAQARLIEEARRDLEASEGDAQAEREALDALREELSASSEDAPRLRAQLAEVERSLDEARAREAERLRLAAERAHRAERARSAAKELEGVERALPQLEAAVDEAQSEVGALLAAVRAAEAKIADARDGRAKVQAGQEAEAARQRGLLAQAAALDGRRRGIEASIQSLEGMPHGAAAVLRAAQEGLLPPAYEAVGAALQVEPDLALAIETALGAAAHDLICPDEDHARRAIELLKRGGLGRATFQPATLMRPQPRQPELGRVLGTPGVVGLASELVSCGERYRAVIESLLGRIVIVRTLRDALSLARASMGGPGQVLDGGGQVLDGAGRVPDGGGQVLDGAGRVPDGGGQVLDGAGRVPDGGGQVLDGAGRVLDGGGQVLDGAGRVPDGGGRVPDGGGQVLDGAGRGPDGGGPVVVPASRRSLSAQRPEPPSAGPVPQGWSRLVTLDGEVVHWRGAVTGGAGARPAHGLVQRRAELAAVEREIADLRARLTVLDQNAARREREDADLRAAIDRARQEADAAQPDLAEAKDWLESLRRELTDTARAGDKLRAEIAALSAAPCASLAEPARPSQEDLAATRDELLQKIAAAEATDEASQQRLREGEVRLRQATARVEDARRRLRQAEQADGQRQTKLRAAGRDREAAVKEIERARREHAEAEVEAAAAQTGLEARQARKRELLEQSLALNEEARKAHQASAACGDLIHQLELARARADGRRTAAAQRLIEDFGITEQDAFGLAPATQVPDDAAQVAGRLRRELKSLGEVNLGAIEAYQRLTDRHDELRSQQEDILLGKAEVEASIRELDRLSRDRVRQAFGELQEAFRGTFRELFGGGEGELRFSQADDILESGIELDVTVPGKKRQPLELLSGGERAMVAMAFLFALLRVRPSPLVVLDEVDAALDGSNVERFVGVLRGLAERSQFILITHNAVTIEAAPLWFGVTMREPGVSAVVPFTMPAEPVVERAPAYLKG